MIPYGADRVVKINTTTGAMTGYNSWPTGFTKGVTAFAGGAFDGRYIWMAPHVANQIVRVDTVDGSMKAYNQWSDMSGFTKGNSAFVGGAFDGESVWLIPFAADRVVKIAANTKIRKLTDEGDTVPIMKKTVSGAEQEFDVDVWMQNPTTDTWTVSSDSPTWLTLSTGGGTGDDTFTVYCQPNSGNTRVGNITVTDADGKKRTLTVTQLDAIMLANPNRLTVLAALASHNIDIYSDIEWTAVSSDPSWLTISASNGGPGGTLTVYCTANTDITERTATVTFTSGKVTIVVPVTQLIANMEVSPETITVPASTGTFVVDIDSDLDWNAVTSAPSWLKISTSIGSASPTGMLTVTYEQNTGVERKGTITIVSGRITRTVQVTQEAPVLSVSLDTKTVTYPAGNFEVELTTNTDWTVTYSAGADLWLSVAPPSGSGDEALTVSYTANAEAAPARTGTITITGNGVVSKTITVMQNAGPYLTTSPADTHDIPSSPGSTFTVNVTANVNWTVSSSTPAWLTATASGSNNGTFTVTYLPNTGASERRGTITVTSPDGVSATIVVTQATGSPNLVVAPFPDIDVTADTGSEIVTVTSNVFWSIISAPTWVDIAPSFGNNNGSFTVTYEANIGTTGRSGTIIVSGGGITREITITQAAGSIDSVEPATISEVTVRRDRVTTSPTFGKNFVTLTGTSDNTKGYFAIYTAEKLNASEDEWTMITDATDVLSATGDFSIEFEFVGPVEFYRVFTSSLEFDGTLTGSESYSTNVGGAYKVFAPLNVRMLGTNQLIQTNKQMNVLFKDIENGTTIDFTRADGTPASAGKNNLGAWSNGTITMDFGQEFQIISSRLDTTVILCGTIESRTYTKDIEINATKLFGSPLPLFGKPDDLGVTTQRAMNLTQFFADGSRPLYSTNNLSTNWAPTTPPLKIEAGEAIKLYYPVVSGTTGTTRTLSQKVEIDTGEIEIGVDLKLSLPFTPTP